MNSANFMSINPSYDIGGVRREPPQGGGMIAPSESYLTNVFSDEVSVVVGIMQRMGFDTITVIKHHPMSFLAE